MSERTKTSINDLYEKALAVDRLIAPKKLDNYKDIKSTIEGCLVAEYGDNRMKYRLDRGSVHPHVYPFQLFEKYGVCELISREYVYDLTNHVAKTARSAEGERSTVGVVDPGEYGGKLEHFMKVRADEMSYKNLDFSDDLTDADIVILNWPAHRVRLSSLPFQFKNANEIIIIGNPQQVLESLTDEDMDQLTEEFDIEYLKLGEGQICYADDLYPYNKFGAGFQVFKSCSQTISMRRKQVEVTVPEPTDQL